MKNHSAPQKNKKYILVVGDFMIDRAWVVSGTSSPTSQMHGDIKPMKRIYPLRNDQRLGGAGMSLAALQSLCRKKEYQIYGIGVWNLKDGKLFRELLREEKISNNEKINATLHRLNVKNDESIITTTKFRLYKQLAEEKPRLFARFDQDPNLDENLPVFQGNTLNDLIDNFKPSPSDISAISVHDFKLPY